MFLFKNHKTTEELKNISYDCENSFKRIVSWIFHNFKFLFIPGYDLEELSERKHQYELKNPKKRRIHRYRKPMFIFGISIIFLLCTITIHQSWLAPYTYIELWSTFEMISSWYLPPSPGHILGTTYYGMDILSRLIYGTGPILISAVTSTTIACVLGIIIGIISAYYGGWLDVISMRIMDIILSFPGIIFAFILFSIWGRNFIYFILIFGIIGMPYFARLVRTSVLIEKELPYITASKVSGARSRRIMFLHILPNCTQMIIIAASFNIARNILSITLLGFLRIYSIGWAVDMAIAIDDLYIAPWAVLYPTLMVLISVLGFLLLGDSLSDIGLLKQEKL